VDQLHPDDRRDLMYAMTGKVRNIIANELGLNRSTIEKIVQDKAQVAVNELRDHKMEQLIDRVIRGKLGDSKAVQKAVEKAVEKVASDLVQQIVGKELQRLSFKVFLEPPDLPEQTTSNPNFGAF